MCMRVCLRPPSMRRRAQAIKEEEKSLVGVAVRLQRRATADRDQRLHSKGATAAQRDASASATADADSDAAPASPAVAAAAGIAKTESTEAEVASARGGIEMVASPPANGQAGAVSSSALGAAAASREPQTQTQPEPPAPPASGAERSTPQVATGSGVAPTGSTPPRSPLAASQCPPPSEQKEPERKDKEQRVEDARSTAKSREAAPHLQITTEPDSKRPPPASPQTPSPPQTPLLRQATLSELEQLVPRTAATDERSMMQNVALLWDLFEDVRADLCYLWRVKLPKDDSADSPDGADDQGVRLRRSSFSRAHRKSLRDAALAPDRAGTPHRHPSPPGGWRSHCHPHRRRHCRQLWRPAVALVRFTHPAPSAWHSHGICMAFAWHVMSHRSAKAPVQGH